MEYYLVGGAVRDKLLNLPFSEKDYVVIGETEDSMLEKGYISVGKKFPVFLHPETKEEYALARKEKKITAGHKGFDFETDNSVTLEQDLSRRDLTINAIAQDKNGDLIDPFNGKKDINNRVLKHISEAFVEDPLRIFRVARFATKLNLLNFKIDESTLALMRSIPNKEIEELSFERIWRETEKVLETESSHIFFEVLRDTNALFVFPEIERNYSILKKNFKKLDSYNLSSKEKWAYLNLKNDNEEKFPISKKFIKFESYSRNFKNTFKSDISPKKLLEGLMKINAFRNQEDALEVISFLSKTDNLNPAFSSLNLNWNTLISELNSIKVEKSLNKKGELIKKEIYNDRLNILENYLNE